MTAKHWIIIACVLGSLSVILGAFGAHSFQAYLEATGRINTYETAIKYQFYHLFAILLVSLVAQVFKNESILVSNWFFLSGIVVFSGSLYLLCLTQIKWLGAITPIGGVCFILGWILAGYKLYKTL